LFPARRLARRLAEAGYRIVEVARPGFDGKDSSWDQHTHLKAIHKKNARVTNRSVGALIFDLHQRLLLDETIVLWTEQMGRTPAAGANNEATCRHHHVSGSTVLLAGGGFKGGVGYGETDECGTNASVVQMTVQDLYAAILHQMGSTTRRSFFVMAIAIVV
jgi:uncharacterized protein (DUF1501 family)